jgi:hypothetical protein
MLSHMVIASAYTADSLQMNVQDMHSGLAIVDLQSAFTKSEINVRLFLNLSDLDRLAVFSERTATF